MKTTAQDWRIRHARAEDAQAVATAYAELLTELRGQPAQVVEGASDALRQIVADPALGVVLVAEAAGAMIGYAALSFVTAVRAGGRYAIVEELWVRTDHRSFGVGAALMDAAVRLCAGARIDVLEVGLPKPSFAGLERTRSFYGACGFTEIGPRMRRTVSER